MALFIWLSVRYIRLVRTQLAPLHPLNAVLFWFDMLHLAFRAFVCVCFLLPLAFSEIVFGGRNFLYALGGLLAPWISGYATIISPDASLFEKVFDLLLIACFLIPWHRLWVTILCFQRHLSDQQGFAIFSIFLFYWPEVMLGLLFSSAF